MSITTITKYLYTLKCSIVLYIPNSTVSKLIGVKKMLNLKVTQTKRSRGFNLKENYFRLYVYCIPS